MTGPCRHRAPKVIEVTTESGFAVKLEREVLDPPKELAALMAGTSTYSRRWLRGEVYHRSAYKIRHEPAGTNPFVTVHPEHRCEGGA